MPSPAHISNIKLSLKFEADPAVLKTYVKNNISITKPKNSSFFVIRQKCQEKTIVFIIYYSGHANITGVHVLSDIMKNFILDFILNLPSVVRINSLKIDNITATGCYPNLMSLINRSNQVTDFDDLLHKLDTEKTFITYIQYSTQKFPGAFIKSTANCTIVLFTSGKFNILGVKCFEKIEEINIKIHDLISTYL